MFLSFSAKKLHGFLALFLTVFCFFRAEASLEEKYTRVVESIKFITAGNQIVAVIRLSDGTNWNFSVDYLEETLLADLEKDLAIGSQITIMPESNEVTYNLCTEFSDSCYEVGITRETKQKWTNRIAKIEKFTIKKGWFSSDEEGYKISLTDGSCWNATDKTVGRHFLNKWKINEGIIVGKIEKKWALLNIDAFTNDQVDFRCVMNVFP